MSFEKFQEVFLENCKRSLTMTYEQMRPLFIAEDDALGKQLQRRAVEWGVYWRAPDAHGVKLSLEQAAELLRDALGVEVEIAVSSAPVAQAAPTPQPQAIGEIRDDPHGGGWYTQWLVDVAALPKPAKLYSRMPLRWREYPEFAPAPDTECLVEVQYGESVSRAVDRWEMQSEAPLSFSSATIEVGYGFSEHNDAVLRWIPISELTVGASHTKEMLT